MVLRKTSSEKRRGEQFARPDTRQVHPPEVRRSRSFPLGGLLARAATWQSEDSLPQGRAPEASSQSAAERVQGCAHRRSKRRTNSSQPVAMQTYASTPTRGHIRQCANVCNGWKGDIMNCG